MGYYDNLIINYISTKYKPKIYVTQSKCNNEKNRLTLNQILGK